MERPKAPSQTARQRKIKRKEPSEFFMYVVLAARMKTLKIIISKLRSIERICLNREIKLIKLIKNIRRPREKK